MKTSYGKMMLAVGLLLIVLSGCSQSAIKKVKVVTNDQGLPEAEELLRVSSEQIQSLESYGIRMEAAYKNYGATKNVVMWEGPFSTTEIQYVKSPYLMYSDALFHENNATSKFYISDPYGVFRNNDEEKWEEMESGNKQEFIESQKENWLLQTDPYSEIKDLNDRTFDVGQDQDRYTLMVTGNTIKQRSQEGQVNIFGNEYTLVITIEEEFRIQYLIDKETLLPMQKIQEVEQVSDYSGSKSYFDRTVTFTYDDYNQVNASNLLNEVKGIAESAKH